MLQMLVVWIHALQISNASNAARDIQHNTRRKPTATKPICANCGQDVLSIARRRPVNPNKKRKVRRKEPKQRKQWSKIAKK